MITNELLDVQIKDIDISVLENIINDSFKWLLLTFDDNSIKINNWNFKMKNSYLKRFITKKQLKLQWSFKQCDLKWYYYGQWAEYDNDQNQITIHFVKNKTLRFTLECLFHEFRHSQQSMRLYFQFKGTYVNHPLEKDANDFCYEYVPIFWDDYIKKLTVSQ